MTSIRSWKWILCTASLASVLAIILRLEQRMIAQVGTLLSGTHQVTRNSISEDWRQSLPSSSLSSIQRSVPSKDWFQEEAWHTNYFTKECWRVEDICHSAHRWFYDPRSLNRDRQPSFSLGLYKADKTALRIKAYASSSSSTFLGRPVKLIVKSPQSTFQTEDADSPVSPSFLQTCKYSPVVNHVVLQSFYNDMLGEFYSRSLAYIYKIYDAVTKTSEALGNGPEDQEITTEQIVASSFPEQTQMYLHVRNFPEHAKLLDSHHLFTDAFRSNALLSFTFLLDYTGCRCLKRLFLCGYDDKSQKGRGVFSNATAITELTPSGNSGPDYLERQYPDVFRDLRQQLRRNVVQANPFIQQDIAQFRAEVIQRSRQHLKRLKQKQVREYRIVGLTQRKGRRKWLDLADIVVLCNTKWFKESDKIVCVETNLEDVDVNPVRQVVIHAACDMLFGIHGAQLSEGVWMKDGSTVVELLPWIPDNAFYGKWTRTTDVPTPLGLLFSNTPLNHIGYRLPRESAPYCPGKTDPADLKSCFSRHLWDDRDFLVDPKVILDLIQKFIPTLSDSQVAKAIPVTSCEDMLQKAGKQVYVLYNVICSNETDGESQVAPSVHHFYWPKNMTVWP